MIMMQTLSHYRASLVTGHRDTLEAQAEHTNRKEEEQYHSCLLPQRTLSTVIGTIRQNPLCTDMASE